MNPHAGVALRAAQRWLRDDIVKGAQAVEQLVLLPHDSLTPGDLGAMLEGGAADCPWVCGQGTVRVTGALGRIPSHWHC